MIRTKVIQVTGDRVSRDGKNISTLGEEIERKFESFFKGVNPDDVIDIKTKINDAGHSTGGSAFFIVIYKGKTISAPLESETESSEAAPRRRGRKPKAELGGK